MTEPVRQSDAFRELHELLASLVLQDISDVELDRLNDLLMSDVELRRVASQYLEQEVVLNGHFDLMNRVAGLHTLSVPASTNSVAGEVLSESDLHLSWSSQQNAGRSSRRYWKLGVAALATTAALLMVIAILGKGAFLSPEDSAAAPGLLVGNITNGSQAVWAEGSAHGISNAPVKAGDTLSLSSGLSEIYFHSGATVILKGPAKLEVLSGMRASLHYGTLTAQVEQSAHGFRIDTPNTKVTDLGTEFGLTVDENGSTDTIVFTGEIAMEYAVSSSQSVDPLEEISEEEVAKFASLALPRKNRLLTEGKALHITSDGTAKRIMSIRESDYPLPSDLHLGINLCAIDEEKPVIESVSDNLSESESSNYYQIVHRGFGEDTRAHVGGRRYQWNGVTEENGLPMILRKADYIKTFCDDKVADHIEITVQLSQAARVFVLFDNRLVIPEWLQEEFEDTGYDVGFDESPRIGRGWQRLDRGPGKSLDSACSVWFKDVVSPGPVVLGALAAPCHQDLMYGIAAVPLQTARATPKEPREHHEPRFGLKLIRKEHLPAPLAESSVEVANRFYQLSLVEPADDDAASYSNGLRFHAEVLSGKRRINPHTHKGVKIVNGILPVLNDGLVSRHNNDTERNIWYAGHGRFSLDLKRSMNIHSINCFSWNRRYRNRQFFTVWGSNDETMPDVDFEHDEQADGWDYIGMAYTRDQREFDTVHATSLQAPSGSLGPYRHLLWISEFPTFFTEIDVHEAE